MASTDTKQEIADEFNVPADRLRGENESEWRADAERLRDLFRPTGGLSGSEILTGDFGSIADRLADRFRADSTVDYVEPYTEMSTDSVANDNKETQNG